jgi:hypothetical protein
MSSQYSRWVRYLAITEKPTSTTPGTSATITDTRTPVRLNGEYECHRRPGGVDMFEQLFESVSRIPYGVSTDAVTGTSSRRRGWPRRHHPVRNGQRNTTVTTA